MLIYRFLAVFTFFILFFNICFFLCFIISVFFCISSRIICFVFILRRIFSSYRILIFHRAFIFRRVFTSRRVFTLCKIFTLHRTAAFCEIFFLTGVAGIVRITAAYITFTISDIAVIPTVSAISSCCSASAAVSSNSFYTFAVIFFFCLTFAFGFFLFLIFFSFISAFGFQAFFFAFTVNNYSTPRYKDNLFCRFLIHLDNCRLFGFRGIAQAENNLFIADNLVLSFRVGFPAQTGKNPKLQVVLFFCIGHFVLIFKFRFQFV